MDLCTAISVFSQKYQATIPYKVVDEKMVIEMNFNGNLRPFIFDTGCPGLLLMIGSGFDAVKGKADIEVVSHSDGIGRKDCII